MEHLGYTFLKALMHKKFRSSGFCWTPMTSRTMDPTPLGSESNHKFVYHDLEPKKPSIYICLFSPPEASSSFCSAQTSRQGPLYPTLRANPFPKVTDLFCRLDDSKSLHGKWLEITKHPTLKLVLWSSRDTS